MSEHVIWETNGGHRVLIVRTNAHLFRPVEGEFINHQFLTGPYFWREDGVFLLDGEKSELDLVIPEGTVIGSGE